MWDRRYLRELLGRKGLIPNDINVGLFELAFFTKKNFEGNEILCSCAFAERRVKNYSLTKRNSDSSRTNPVQEQNENF